MAAIVLASASQARERLLQQLGIRFSVAPSRTRESGRRFFSPEIRVKTLALEKAKRIASQRKHGLVIGADTVIVHKGKIVGKPRNHAEAERILRELNGRTHNVVTGIAIVDAETGRRTVDHVKTWVKMKKLTEKEIEAYVSTGEPLGKAGAYAIQDKGAIFIERIEGCYYNVVGLPLPRLADMLKKFGVTLME